MILRLSVILLVSLAVSALDEDFNEPRLKRSPENKQPWELNPNIDRDENGNVITDVNIKRTGENHNIEASWNKVVRGPNRAKPTWHVGGNFRWRRSLEDENVDGESRVKRSPENQPWELNPNIDRDEDGNVITDINIKRTGENHNIEASWNKVLRGPNRAKPTWHVGGNFRWRRSLEDKNVDDESRVKRSPENQPWELNPNIDRDEDGNVITDINIKRTGENHNIEASWNKVLRGPNQAKPTWHVGGNFRWRRSLEDKNVDDESRVKRSPENQPWELNPNIDRDEDGNVITDINIKRAGENHNIEASWNKVLRGPNRAKPTWHVGGNFRWRRSLEDKNVDDESRVKRSPENQPWELNPNIDRDEDGNVITDINIKRTGENHNIEASWNKVLRGPNQAKPTWHVGGNFRWRRSLEDKNVDDESRVKRSPENQPWELNPNIDRDEDGNVITDINIKRTGENHNIEASWNKVLRGPNRAKPTWHVGGNFRWRRSLEDKNVDDESRVKRSPENQPWELNPNIDRDEDGNVITDINIKRTGENHNIEASWNKVLRGPNRAKPTWHVGGNFRWRRSLEDENVDDESRVKRSPENQPWELNPNIDRDEDGNVISDINIKRTGENHNIEASWNKVLRGPNRAKPTWHVGGNFRWRRSLEDENVDDESRVKRSPENQPWELNPNIDRDEDGNVISDINIKRTGENHNIEASWNKVLRGPNRAKPTWHVGGNFRWRRSLEDENVDDESRVKRSPENQPWELNPNIDRDEDGNVITDINIKRTGENHNIEASWNKVVRGPNRAKPTWHVGGNFRWRRSLQPVNQGKQPWELNPQIERDGNGNVRTDVNIKRTGENNDFEAGWSKVVRGPNRAKPTWHIGGTTRWRRFVHPIELNNGDEVEEEFVHIQPDPREFVPQFHAISEQ